MADEGALLFSEENGRGLAVGGGRAEQRRIYTNGRKWKKGLVESEVGDGNRQLQDEGFD
jgi:hypothetical protein